MDHTFSLDPSLKMDHCFSLSMSLKINQSFKLDLSINLKPSYNQGLPLSHQRKWMLYAPLPKGQLKHLAFHLPERNSNLKRKCQQKTEQRSEQEMGFG
jgi:hypothetical protein